MSDKPIRVLLVEDELDVAAGIGDYLGHHGLEVDFAANAHEALHLCRQTAFDVLLLDLHLPGEDGVALCRRLKQQCQLATPVLFLTAEHGLSAKLDAFEAGALDYVVKPFEPAELLARIRALRQRVATFSAALLTVDRYRLDIDGHVLLRDDGRRLPLTAVALRLLQALMQAYPASVRRAALHDALWQGEPPDSDPLRAHVHQLRRLLSTRFDQPLIATIRGVGYRFDPDDTPS